MQKISLQKRSFFNSIGLDTKNIPSELKVKTTNLTKKIPSEDVVFFKNKNLVTSERKHFRLKNLIGTVSNEYDGKSWIEIFVNNDKSDEMIKQYFKNPNYYFKELRKLDQTSLNHNNEIELYEDNGKFFVKDGTARLALMMTKYLLETSRAQTKEEQSLINKQYIFAANVKSAPKDRDVIYLINMLIEIYGTKLKISKVPGNYECKYVLQYGDRIFEINSKKELENFIKNSYLPKSYKSEEKLKSKIAGLTKIGISYKLNEKSEDAFLVMGKIFPNYEFFVKYYKKAQKYNIENKLFSKLDLENITYEVILKNLIKVVKDEEKKIKEDNLKVTKENKSKEKKEKKQKKNVSEAKEENQKLKNAKNNTEKKEEDKAEELRKKLDENKKKINEQVDLITENIETTYYKLKSEEARVMDIANSTNITLNIDKMNDDSINASINSIKENIIKTHKKINSAEKIDDLKNINELSKDLNKIIDSKNIVEGYSNEMESIFKTCFNKEIQKLITDSKLKKLEKQRLEIEQEKCSFFSKLLGKAKLKQAKLDNINLKKQLILSESQYINKSYYYLEDGLSEVYTYLKEETDETCLSDIRLFLRNIEQNSQIKNMINQDKLNNLVKEKMEQKRNLPQLVLSKEKRKLFSKAQINLMEEKNNELKRVIQITRANSLKLQNTGMIPILGNIKTTKSINKFCNNLNEINNTLKYQNQ
jgi:5'-3' exonuclease domain-containing protein